MITNEDPTEAGVFRVPSPETIAGFDDEQLDRAGDRAANERMLSFQAFSRVRLTAVLMGVVVCIAVIASFGVLPSITSNTALTVVSAFTILVFVGAVRVAMAKRNDVAAWNTAEDRIAAEITRRRRGSR